MPPHECKQEQELVSVGRQLKVLFGLIGLLLTIMIYAAGAVKDANEKVQQAETSQAEMKRDIAWIKEALVDIKAEVKRKP